MTEIFIDKTGEKLQEGDVVILDGVPDHFFNLVLNGDDLILELWKFKFKRYGFDSMGYDESHEKLSSWDVSRVKKIGTVTKEKIL